MTQLQNLANLLTTHQFTLYKTSYQAVEQNPLHTQHHILSFYLKSAIYRSIAKECE